MRAKEVASLLNLELPEFQKIEASIASVLRLKMDESGQYVYRQDHVDSLKDVFADLQNRGSEATIKTAPYNPENVENGAPERIPTPARTATLEESERKPQRQMQLETVERQPGASSSQEQNTPVEERNIRSAIPYFERIQKDRDEQGAPELGIETLEINSLVKMIQEQKAYFENRIREIEQGDLKILREENLQLKKQLLIHKKEKETLKNIIRNQNEDKRYLIEKLNEKFSLKNIIQWKTGGSRSFEGFERI